LADPAARLDEIPWALGVYAVIVVLGFVAAFNAVDGLTWGDYLGAITITSGLHGVAHGIRYHARATRQATATRVQ
jgi:hypothetical protein